MWRSGAMNIDDFIVVLSNQEVGENLEYDSEFLALMDEVSSKEESQYGDYLHIPEPIDWASVETRCVGLFARTLDLRVAVYLTLAWLEREGLAGLAKGLAVLDYLVRERWEQTYPRLSDEDQFDPLVRINILAELAVPSVVVATLRKEVLARLPGGESLCCADLALIASGQESPERDACLLRLESQIEPQCSTELMRGLGALNRVKGLLDSIGQGLDEKTGLCESSPLQPVSRLLGQWIQVVDSRLRRTLHSVAPEPEVAVSASTPAAVVSAGGVRECRSREEVLLALDAIAGYYQRHEPSSPIPMLVQRVRRLAGMDFLEIMAELAPSSVSDMRALAGIQEE